MKTFDQQENEKLNTLNAYKYAQTQRGDLRAIFIAFMEGAKCWQAMVKEHKSNKQKGLYGENLKPDL